MKLEKQYTAYFELFFKNVKEVFNKSVNYCADDELSLGDLAHKKAIWSLPCPIHAARLVVDTDRHKEASGKIYHLIAYELSRLGKTGVNYYGEINIEDIGNQRELLENLKLEQKYLEELKTFKFLGFAQFEPWFYLTVIPYDILENPIEHARDFRFNFSMMFAREILNKFGTRIDFNSKYHIKSEPLLSVADLLKKDEAFSGFVKIDGTGVTHEITLEDMQRDVCDLQLIPRVPDDVKHVFNAAKKIYIFGFFDYYLFSVSQHYAFLALESGLRNKYRELHGESRKFVSLDQIIKDLVINKVIPKGEEQMYDSGRYLRNTFSHLARRTVVPPGPGILEGVAYQINCLYDS